MGLTKVLITVKTYPSLSHKYEELVCTAGLTERGEPIRIYPIPFRKLDYSKQFKKYQWIEIDLVKNESDSRPESFRPRNFNADINTLGELGKNGSRINWEERKDFILQNVYYDMSDLIQRAQDKKIGTSLAVFKPSKITKFFFEETEREWDKDKIKSIMSKRAQLSLFDDPCIFNVVDKLPYIFKYEFEDCNGKKSTMKIEDWEIGQLYWNTLKQCNYCEEEALKKVKDKYFDFFLNKRDIYFFLGTTKIHHWWVSNPFMIIGVFYPPKEAQLNLFK